jgi:hypothetical protein
VNRNPNYWKPGLPYLDGIEYTIIPNRSTLLQSREMPESRHPHRPPVMVRAKGMA